LFAEVSVFNALEKTLHYLVPEPVQGEIRPGKRVLVPLGSREAMGLVLGLESAPPALPKPVRLRPILTVLDPQPVIPDELLSLCRWMSLYYFHPLGDVLETVLPRELFESPRLYYRLTASGRAARGTHEAGDILSLFQEDGTLCVDDLKDMADISPAPPIVSGVSRSEDGLNVHSNGTAHEFPPKRFAWCD